MLHSLLKQ